MIEGNSVLQSCFGITVCYESAICMDSVSPTHSAGGVRSTMQLYNHSSKAYLVNAVLLKIPVLQSCWSTAVSGCRISIAKLLKHSHKLAQLPLSEIVEKSSKSPDWDSCSSERDCLMCKYGYLLSCKEKCRISDSRLSHPGKGRCRILRNADLGNAVESHPAAWTEQCRKHKALAPRVGTN